MPDEAASRVFQFGVFEANEATGELRKQGARIKLHSQPFHVLILLLDKPGAVVTRKEMQQRLWGNDTFVDFEHGLNTAVNKIREALDDSALQPRYVETVPGKGYRFIAPVAMVGAVSQPAEKEVPAVGEGWTLESALLTVPHELPKAPRRVVRTLLLLMQAMYLAFYFGALANWQEVREIFLDVTWLPPAVLLAAVVITASLLIPVRLFLAAAVAFDFSQLPEKFRRMFPLLLPLDLLWAVSPFLLVHHVSTGLALGMSAALVYLPFAQRSLMLMYGREGL
jgi:DNA-binding winged helix-turn-helix (wHTH) protein